ncbi:helix-turn-helix domain-containing protein [Clostridium sp. D33t1_170424_F3]|uniref:helix-turn-helix domain-containing protein n=1 Tax=Clostridium sp. D33t1_170424_F3 TaxID=2787099 RepID=UPI0018AC0DB0
MIKYDKLFRILKDKGYNATRIRDEKLIGQGTLTALRRHTGGLDAKTINKLCRVLQCQPGDLMEYVDEENSPDKL